MSPEDARLVVQSVDGVDGDCPYCFAYVIERLAERFPDVDWRALGNDLTVLGRPT